MTRIPENYLERLYGGWLAKIIGIRLGAPIEGWTYEKIRDVYGNLDHYPVDYTNFAADDDSNGPLFYLRALRDSGRGADLTAQDVGAALLNYAAYERGFFWWGGYGVSTEHTAYLNLANGVPAPLSGSIALNGATVAEQIGGQIFIDTWGLVAPGNTRLAAKFAREASSVTHDGNGVYGGIFIAVCISCAFVERDIHKIIEEGLMNIPADCEYTRVVRAVIKYHAERPDNWHDCFKYVHDNFGYDKYAGACHIIPNSAVIVLSLLYGGGDFERTITICNMCGWDTDCNVGNVATIMGVRNGVGGIDYEKWIKPVNDLLVCSSVIGSLNIMDIPYGASFIAALAYELAGETPPAGWSEILNERMDSCHFEYPRSTHAMRVRTSGGPGKAHASIANSDEQAYTGKRSLKLTAMPVNPGESKIYLYKKTYYLPGDFDDSRYDPDFSPLLYPGQTVAGSAFLPDYSREAYVRMYAREQRSGEEYLGERVLLKKGEWARLTLELPARKGGLIGEAGFLFEPAGEPMHYGIDFTAFVDDFYFEGTPDYSVEFADERLEEWTFAHKEISQFTRYKGLAYLTDGQVHVSGADRAEIYTGRHDFGDYTAEFAVTPVVGDVHTVNFRVQGAMRSYAFGFDGPGKLKLLKNTGGYLALAEARFDWEMGREYTLIVTVNGNRITCALNGVILEYEDTDNPYMAGSIGLSVRGGSHIRCRCIAVRP